MDQGGYMAVHGGYLAVQGGYMTVGGGYMHWVDSRDAKTSESFAGYC